MRAKEMRYYILACIGIPASIILFIGFLTFVSMANDLDKRIIRQENYIKQLEQELKYTEMICTQ